MNKGKANRNLCSLFLLTVLLVTFASLPASAGLFSVSDAEVIQAGRQAHLDAMKQYGAWNNPAQLRRINRLGRRLTRFSQRPEIHYQFYLVNDNAVNAFATPDGSIHVTKGLAAHFPDNNQLLFVLGHEMTHVERRHGKQQVEKAMAIQAGGNLLLLALGAKGALAQLGMSGAAFWLNMKYSRDFETQADEGGMILLQKAGVDPHYGPKALEHMAQVSKNHPSLVEKYFGSHPLSAERIQHAKQFADRLTRKH